MVIFASSQTEILDHENGDIIKNIVVNSLDRDLDPEDATVRLIISDGAPPTIDIIPPVSLSEVNLADGSSPSLPVSDTEADHVHSRE